MADLNHPAACAVRAARAYKKMSRAQLAGRVGLSAETIGRWERGEWADDPPKAPMLEAIARESGILGFVESMAGYTDEPDPARRFAAAARREAERRAARRASGREAPAGAGVEGEAP